MKIAAAAWLVALTCAVASAAEKVSFIKIDGAIGPATASYISRSIEEARAQNAQCLVIQLNTPGGLLDSTQNIVQSFFGSPVPVVVYVAPTASTATSARCFIILAGRVLDGKTGKTAVADMVEIKMSASERVFQKLWRPEVMFVLMLIAMYGIIGELTTPGAILPGVVGAIALILALYLAAILPINVTGLVLIALALMLFIFDVYAPTHALLTVGGVISFLIGSLMLFNRADPLFRLSLSYIIPATLITAAFFVFVIGKGLRAQLMPVKAGAETMIGKTVATLTPIDSHGGRIFIEGEYWNAVSDTPIEKDEVVEIAAVQGLTLKVKTKGE